MRLWFRRYVLDLFLSARFFTAATACSLLFLFRFFIDTLGMLPYVFTLAFCTTVVIDYVLMFIGKQYIRASRFHAERFSNGDDNQVRLQIFSGYTIPLTIEVIDEIPHQFQRRDVLFRVSLGARQETSIVYALRPVQRGAYQFGDINIYAGSALGLVKRRFVMKAARAVPVYPSYLQMRKYQLMAVHNRLDEMGVKKMRQIGHTMEFEQIKDYVGGDDYRTLNWKATARKGQLMVNHYADEKSQQVYCVLDKGRTMKMPFDGLSLLDYAINASLVLLNIALMKEDKAGLITFSEQFGTLLKADRKATQMQLIQEVLYNQKTRFLESDYERLYSTIRIKIPQRSLVILFTNFESMSGLGRQLPYLRKMAMHHLLLVVFFENTGLQQLTREPARDIEGIYHKTVAEKFVFEKKLIVKELQAYGILSILTAPKNLTVNVINKYLELKAHQRI